MSQRFRYHLAMQSERQRQSRTKPGEGMIGVRMPATTISEIKAEARRRKISVGTLLQELWGDYLRTKTKTAP